MAGLHWNAEALRVQLAPLLPGVAIEIAATTGSTNTDLLERARASARAIAGDPRSATSATPPIRRTRTTARDVAGNAAVQVRRSIESGAYAGGTRAGLGSEDAACGPHTPCLLVAEQQTAGRGRMGRVWHAEPGASLTFSLALELGAVDWSGLSLAVGVALADALDPTVEGRAARIALKWPNDLWLLDEPGRGRKLGGVLIESIPFGAKRVAVVGVGLNVRPAAAHADFASGYACMQELMPSASAPALLAEAAPALVEALQLFERSGFAAFHERYAARDLLFGQAVRTSGADGCEGIAEGVTSQGALIVRNADGQVQQVVSGEVSVRLADPASACGNSIGHGTAEQIAGHGDAPADNAPAPPMPTAARC
ncbi:MAG: biotin--[acetyl-CoA-carboxylase] ligase [Caldimonas sp.]